MEMFELKYFLAVAKYENLQRAAEAANASPGSLSKAISRLENELHVPLFRKEGRNIRLTLQGKSLQLRASEIIHREEATRLELSQGICPIQITISGPEILLSQIGVQFMKTLSADFPQAQYEFIEATESAALDRILDGTSHLALISTDILTERGRTDDLFVHPIRDVVFRTFSSPSHPLFNKMKRNGDVSINEVLEFDFASTGLFIGRPHGSQSADGWRDDVFRRKIKFSNLGVSVLLGFVESGQALGFLPDYFEGTNLRPLNIADCPFTCRKSVVLVARSVHEVSWLEKFRQRATP